MKGHGIWFILLFLSCTEPNSTTFSFDSFSENINLEGEKLELDKVLNPNKILLKEDYLILSENGHDKLLHIFSKEGVHYIRSVGKQGEGPGEIRSGVWELDAGLKPATFWAYDLAGKSFYEFSLEDSSSLAQTTIQQGESWFMGVSMHWKKSNQLISYISKDPYKFGVFDTLGNRISSLGLWDNDKPVDEKTAFILSDVYQGPISMNQNSQVLVHAGSKYEFFEIYNLNSGKFTYQQGPTNFELDFTLTTDGNTPFAILDKDTPRGFIDVYAGEKSIFLAYIGKTHQEIMETGELSRDIFQVDLNGKPMVHFRLNHAIRSFTVDEKAQKIYAVIDEKNPGIGIFQF